MNYATCGRNTTVKHAISRTPFVGVCGVRTAAEYSRLVSIAQRILPGTGRFVMAGIKDISGDLDIIDYSEVVRPFVHCDYTEHEPFEEVVAQRMARAQHFVCGLQLNALPWMEYDYRPLWQKLRQRHPKLQLMLQAHRDIMERYTPIDIAERLEALPVDYLLFDASQSRGAPYDLDTMRKYVAAIYERQLSVGVVVSGGLGEANAMRKLFAPLAGEFPNISCDAFLRIYDIAANSLSWPAVEQYILRYAACVPRGSRYFGQLAYSLDPKRYEAFSSRSYL